MKLFLKMVLLGFFIFFDLNAFKVVLKDGKIFDLPDVKAFDFSSSFGMKKEFQFSEISIEQWNLFFRFLTIFNDTWKVDETRTDVYVTKLFTPSFIEDRKKRMIDEIKRQSLEKRLLPKLFNEIKVGDLFLSEIFVTRQVCDILMKKYGFERFVELKEVVRFYLREDYKMDFIN
ncbi:TPA: hypothetical protein DEO28_00865 [Candidatus Dependentiae bacterium]|nr:MAG: hypothetical protein UR14_C0003G0025 [candidate division TM6 bacterium GW2011_GWE2_31_21]KKP54145.1 MAG: hypothetical protein UR43_C0001G0163 [candidate division TM6 bacterium GW2011_GWF2_33_332]HBS47866.1 hypothetical protein [Candidatus Dependentiae bacterium]HBZ73051.1 hypothetical protein [Candidatus Dependentiae bacterium]